MLIRKQYLMVGAGLLAVAIMGWFSQEVLESQDEVNLVMEHQSDFHMRGLKLYVSGDDGSAKYHLSARSLVHFPLNDTMTLETPQIVVYRQGQPAWVMAAEQGILKNREQQLDLYQGVTLYKGESNNSPLRLETESLLIDLGKKQASSVAEIFLQQHDVGELRGRGLLLDLQQNRLQLQSQVRVRYENY